MSVAKALYPVTHLALLQRIISSFDQFNYDLQNHFMASNYNGVNISNRIREHEEVYRRIAICCIAGDLDYICHADTNARPTAATLPNDIAYIIFHAKHAHFSDFPILAKMVNQYLFADGKVDADFLKSQKPAISDVFIPKNFSEKLNRLAIHSVVEGRSSTLLKQTM